MKEYMEELYENMGFTSNPFSRFSAEEEKEYLEDIYIKPRYYRTVYNDIKDGASRFIIGERGIGKTALMLNLEQDLEKNNVFSVLIDEYDGIPNVDNKKQLLLLIMRKIVTKYAVYLLNNRSVVRKLDKSDREKIAFYIDNFFETLSQDEYERTKSTVTKYRQKRIFAQFFNFFLLKPINSIFSGASEWISTTVTKSLGLPSVSDSFYKSYIPEISVTENQQKIEVDSLEYIRTKQLLKMLIDCIVKSGFNSVVVFFDKIDEYQNLGTNIQSIADFIKGIALDTGLLQTEKCAFVFVVWSKVRDELNSQGVRYDKFKPIDVTWSDDELKNILNRRLGFFSDNKVDMFSLLENDHTDELLELANKSPRQLIVLMSRIYDEQEAENVQASVFSDAIVEKGIRQFVCNFDFPSLYPGEKGKKSYIVNVVNSILKIGKHEFGSSDLVAQKKYSSQAANNDIKIMKNYGLIEEKSEVSGHSKVYKVVDPIIRHMINRTIEEMSI